MADLTDVQNALVAIVAAALYPSGTGAPSVPGMPVKIYAGWPLPQQLDADLKAGTCHVTVYSRAEERNTTRYGLAWQPQTLQTATLTLTATGQTVTIGGAIPPVGNPHNAVVFANTKPYVYAVQPSDALAGVAAALAALIAVDVPGTTAAGAVLTLPSSARVGAVRVGVTGTVIRETGRQEKLFQISVWADTPDHRTAVAVPTNGALSGTLRFTLPDGSSARLIYKSTFESDKFEKDDLYRRDLLYTVEFATTQTDTATQVTAIETDNEASIDGGESFQPVSTTFT